MVVYEYVVTGHHKEAIPKIDKLLNKIFNNFKEYKIGRTDNPDSRFNKPDYDDYEYMYVLYESTSIDNVMFLEDYFCNQYKQKLNNINCGSAGDYDEESFQYLYVVVI